MKSSGERGGGVGGGAGGPAALTFVPGAAGERRGAGRGSLPTIL